MTINTYSDISSFVNTIFEDALFVARDNNLMIPLVTTFDDKQGMAARKNQTYGTATINSIAETDDLVSQQFKPTALSTLTPGEYGGQFFISDQRLESDPFGARNDAANELGMAMAERMEIDMLGNFSSLTGGTVGAAGTVITWGHFFAALTLLRAQKAPQPYFCVLHPYQWHVLAKAASVAGASVVNAPEFQDEITRNWFVGRVGPVNVFTTTNISINGSTDAYGGLFSRGALAMDFRRAPRLEPERDASRRGWELNMSAIYAHGVWRPTFGIQMLFNAATPSS